MYNLKLSHIKTIAYCWLALPAIIFIIGWLRPIISIPMVSLVVVSLYLIIKREKKDEVIPIHFNKKSLLILAILFIWYLFSGVGGYTWQEPWDHSYRNAVFDALVTHDWPVIEYDNGEKVMLCYYFGFWLPAALVSKIFGSIAIGEFVQFIYGFAGILLCMLLVFNYLKGIKLRYVLTFILFGGASLLVILFFPDSNRLGVYLSSTSYNYFCSNPITNQLYYIYNSSIPSFIVLALLLKEKNQPGNLFYLLSLLTIFSPFTCAGLGFCILYLTLKKYKESLTLQNITGILFAVLMYLFYKSNLMVESPGLYDIDTDILLIFICFIAIEYILCILMIYRQVKPSLLFKLTFFPLFLLLWIKLGDAFDFAWKVTAPASFFLMIMFMQYISDYRLRKNLSSLIFSIYISFCVIPPLILILRHFKHTSIGFVKRESMKANDIKTIFDDSPCHDNFVANNQNSIFIKYLIK